MHHNKQKAYIEKSKKAKETSAVAMKLIRPRTKDPMY